MRRGNVRAAILLLLEEEPRNGYQVMQEIEQRSEGAWRPSPGSVYPAFQLLADEGLIRGEARDGGNVFELTDAGRAYVEENREKLGNPWQQAGEGMPDGVRELIHLAMQVGMATRQVTHHGSEAQRAEAAKVLAETRRVALPHPRRRRPGGLTASARRARRRSRRARRPYWLDETGGLLRAPATRRAAAARLPAALDRAGRRGLRRSR